MAKISPLFKRIFVYFNCVFAIFGVVVFSLGLYLQQYTEEVNDLRAVIYLYMFGSIVFLFSVLGAYGAYKESKCALIVFCVLMGLATAGMLRLAIPLAVSHQQVTSSVREYLQHMLPLTKDNEHFLDPIQTHLHCCGLFNGYKDWKEVPGSCNCENDTVAACERVTTGNEYKEPFFLRAPEEQRVWSKPCGPLIIDYVDEALYIIIAVLFGLAVLALLGCLMSFAMILRISAPAHSQLPNFPLPYDPPKYTELVH